MTEKQVENILILGNGFDLAMNRKTHYTDFLEFMSVVPNFLYLYEMAKSLHNEISGCDKKTLINWVEESLKNSIKDTNYGIFFLERESYDKLIKNEFSSKSVLFLISFFKKEIQKFCCKEPNVLRENYSMYLKSSLERYYDISGIVKKSEKLVIDDNPDFCSLFKYRRLIKALKNEFKAQYEEIYNDLMDFVDRLDNADKCPKYDLPIIISLVENNAKVKLVNTYNNNILKFIEKNKAELGKNWSSLELIISDLANALNDIKQNIKDYENYFNSKAPELSQAIDELKSYENRLGQDMSTIIYNISDIDYKSGISTSDFAHKSNPMAYAYIIDNIRKINSVDKPLKSVIDELNEKLIKDLKALTDWLEFYLTYLDRVEEIQVNKDTVLSEFRNISKVINFNYTDTITKYDVKENNIHFIHGRLNFDRSRFPINQMVFGIEDKESNVEDISPDLIPYQKFYQRIVKETGNDYQEFFESDSDKIILVFGHSVDPLDKEIFQNCFRLLGDYQEKNEKMIDNKAKVNYRFIFAYYDEDAKQSIVKNLAIILGKQRLVTLTGQKKIQFVKNNDRDKIRSILKEWEESRQFETAE